MALSQYDLRYGACREIGHAWFFVRWHMNGTTGERVLRCQGCGATRRDHFRNFRVERRRYGYKPGYLVKNVVDLDIALEVIIDRLRTLVRLSIFIFGSIFIVIWVRLGVIRGINMGSKNYNWRSPQGWRLLLDIHAARVSFSDAVTHLKEQGHMMDSRKVQRAYARYKDELDRNISRDGGIATLARLEELIRRRDDISAQIEELIGEEVAQARQGQTERERELRRKVHDLELELRAREKREQFQEVEDVLARAGVVSGET